MNQDPTKVPQALDVINPMENVVAQPEIVEPLKGGFSNTSVSYTHLTLPTTPYV